MPDSRTDSLVQLAQDTARRITGSHTAWMAYLQTAARLYKYPYHEQLLIFAQRPQATACAGYEVWTNTMRRYVRRGAKGIALLDTSGDAPRLRYVFDVADTGELSQSRSLNLWKLSEENAQAVSLSLENGYDVPAREGLERQLRAISSQLAGACWVDRKQEIFDIVDGSFLEGYDEGAIGASFRRAASVSLEYALRSRCGLANEGRFIREDFIPVMEWNTPEAAAALGTAVSEMSGEVLRTIEISIRNHERSLSHDYLPAERRDPDSRPEAQRNREPAPGQVRADAQDVPANASDDAVEQPAAKRDIAGAPAGDRRGGTEPSGAADAGADEGRGRDGGIESQRPDAMGRPDERLQGAGRGNHPQGAGVQLSFLEGLAAQPGTERAESDMPSALSIPQEVVDEVLRVGGNTAHHRERIVAAFEKQKPDTPDFLRSLLHGGNGIVTDAGTFAVWYGETGIRISRGRAARHAPSAKLVSWQEAAGRIGQLLEEGRFAANVELAGAEGYERFRLAEKLWYLRQDFSGKALDAGYLSSLAKDGGRDFSEDTEWLAEKLTDPAFRARLKSEYRQFLSDQQQSGDLLRFHFHRLDEIQEALEDLDLPRRAFSSEMAEIPPVRQFITEDEIDANLAGGGLMSGSKGRIFAFFQQPHSNKEQVDFLKQEYGTGGRSHALSNADGSDESHSGKGIRYQKRDCPEVRLTWQKVAGRIAGLIRQGLYLTEQEQAEYDRSQAEKVQAEKDAPQAPKPDPAVWEYNGVKERHPDDLVLYQMGDFFELYGEDAREAAPELGLQLVSRAIPGGGRVEMCGFPENRLDQYLEQLRVRHDVTVSTASEGSAQRREYSVLSNGPEIEPVDDEEAIHPAAIREALERRGIVGGQVADPERVESDPFIQQVMADAEQASASPEEAPDGTGVAPFPYAVGDTVRLEDEKPFLIEEVGTFTIRLRDPSLAYPIIRAESRESFARLMERYPQTALSSAQNFRITDDDLGVGGAKTRYGWNVAAIRTLRALEAEDRPATLQEQETLSRYVGWGGIPQAFDAQNEDWRKEYAELKALLSETEYVSARASTLNAHYTSPAVIRAIYDAVEQMGFRTGNILEPAMGVGNFFGLLPESMAGSRLYGVELDSITGRIARQLYPEADITVAGFETTDRRDFFDLAVGNVPFGNYQVNDKAYNHLRFNIHDYFFAKAIDQVRPGGIIAFVTSKGTMDKQSPDVRRFIAQRAELLGAIRLPNNAFARNANTEVTSDILFLQKRDRPITLEPDWVHLGQTGDGIPVNSYFAEHPEMILGRMAWDDSMYGSRKETACLPLEGADLASQLHEAVERLQGSYLEAEPPELGTGEAIRAAIPADPNVKNYTYTVVDGQVYYRENSLMVRPDLSAAAEARVKGMVSLRDCVQELIALQMDPATPDSAIREQQAELNRRYDAYTAKYGLLNSRGNAQAFSDDSSYYLLCSLEILDEDGNLRRKADMFTKRTIKPHEAVTSVDTASEALAVSIAEKARVDMEYMEQLTGKTSDELAAELQGVIYRLPESAGDEPCYVTADEYLSGNIRSKIASARLAAEKDEAFQINVSALEKAMPKDLDASEIEVRLGATWIPPRYIQQFMLELLQPPIQARYRLRVAYSSATAEWQIENKSSVPAHNVAAYTTYGTGRASAYRILEDSLNLRDVRIYDTVQDADGKEKRVLNSKETTLAQQKQQAVKDAFRDWLWQDPTRRQELCARYNELFNATRPREYDGSHIRFSGMNPEITLRRHQRDAIAHILYGGNCLLAHEVGAGKTFEMVAACMESKRLGLCSKALFAVPNHLTEQWASEFLRLYPSANLLVASKKDFETKNRKKFCARIATGDYDAIIIGHSQFEKIPISQERQERLLQEQIDEIEEGVQELRVSHAERFTIKQLERMKRQLETRLQKLTSATRKDDVVTFEQLGVDRLYVDEAHNYKNLFLYTKMRNVAGLSTTDAQKSSDMYLKCRYMDELTGGRGIVFATGTPVSNSMTELYTMMRYLQHDLLASRGFSHFDCWASTFGETVTAIELAPEGTGYRARTRFARFFNLPELMAMFREAADIKTADQLHLPTPEAVYHNVVAKPTEMQKDMVEALSKRAAEVHAGVVNPREDNMLKITSDGRKLGLDQRILNPLLPDDEHSKVNQCVANILRIWREGESGKLTQLVFSDLSTPGGEGFTVYEDIRRKLIAAGVPEGEIAFIHDANTEVKKKELFAKVRAGQVRVLLGSTQKMGAGTNVQDRLAALHDLDCPWRPGDLEQRKGRIVRQGNRNDTVHIYRYVTENTFDAYLWQTIENKQKFISQIMTSKSPVRSCEDVDETALSYAEIKALCAGNPLIKEKMDLDIEVARLRLLKANHQSQRFQMEDRLLKYFPVELEKCRAQVGGFEADLETRSNHPLPSEGFVGMEVLGHTFSDKEEAGKAILEAVKTVVDMKSVRIGHYRGFEMSLELSAFGREYILTLRGRMAHFTTLGSDPRGNIQRIDNTLGSMESRLKTVQDQIATLQKEQEAAKEEIAKPFAQEDELREKSARLIELDTLLDIGKGSPEVMPEGGEPEAMEAAVPDAAQGTRDPERKERSREEVR